MLQRSPESECLALLRINWAIEMLNLGNLKNAAPVGCKSARMSSVLFPIINKQNNKAQKEQNNIIFLNGWENNLERNQIWCQ